MLLTARWLNKDNRCLGGATYSPHLSPGRLHRKSRVGSSSLVQRERRGKHVTVTSCLPLMTRCSAFVDDGLCNGSGGRLNGVVNDASVAQSLKLAPKVGIEVGFWVGYIGHVLACHLDKRLARGGTLRNYATLSPVEYR